MIPESFAKKRIKEEQDYLQRLNQSLKAGEIKKGLFNKLQNNAMAALNKFESIIKNKKNG